MGVTNGLDRGYWRIENQREGFSCRGSHGLRRLGAGAGSNLM